MQLGREKLDKWRMQLLRQSRLAKSKEMLIDAAVEYSLKRNVEYTHLHFLNYFNFFNKFQISARNFLQEIHVI